MEEREKRLVALDLMIARATPSKEGCEETKILQCGTDMRLLIKETDKVLTTAKAERRALIAKLLKAAEAVQ